MKLDVFLNHLRREARGERGKSVFFVACLAIGVAAVVAVAGFCEGLDRGIRGEARKLLAADLAVQGRQPLPDDIAALIDAVPGSRRTTIREMLTLVATNARSSDGTADRVGSLLVELKSIDGEYPFYGELKLSSDRPLAELLAADGVVAAPEVLSRLGLSHDDTLKVGGQRFQINATVEREGDRIAGAFSMGPRLFISADGLDRAGLEQFGSRILYRTLIRLPNGDEQAVEEMARRIKDQLPGDGRYRVETYREAQPALRQGLDRMERYLGLAALLSLLIGGVGVAQTVRAWVAGRLDTIAVLKCVGYRPREAVMLYLSQVAGLAVAGSLFGIALGFLVQLLAAQLLVDVLPVELIDPWQPLAMTRGLLLGVGVSLLFSIPPLATVYHVPPIRVLRRGAEPLPPSRMSLMATASALVVGLVAIAAWQAGSLGLALAFTGGLVLLTAILGGAALLLMRLSARPRRRSRLWLRQGLANLSRPGAGSLAAIIALGLGVLVVLTMLLVERHLGNQLDRDVPDDAPTAFLVDIQPDQWPRVRAQLEAAGSHKIDSVPVVMARISAIDGDGAEAIRERRAQNKERYDDDDDGWALRREQRLTYLDELPADNVVLEGTLWGDPERAELSVEKEFADQLGLRLGSVVSFDIQGVPLDLTVTSLRSVDWTTFGINFFWVVEPGVLDDAPQFRIAAASLPPGEEQALQDQLAFDHPNVTLIRIRDVLDRLAAILHRLALGVRLLGILTVLAGLAILVAAISVESLRRGLEVALLKTLGMTRGQVIASFATEYALLGLVAGILGGAGGTVLAWWVLTRDMEVAWRFEPTILLLAVAGAALLTVLAGLAASLSALRRPPIDVLRRA